MHKWWDFARKGLKVNLVVTWCVAVLLKFRNGGRDCELPLLVVVS